MALHDLSNKLTQLCAKSWQLVERGQRRNEALRQSASATVDP